MRSTAKILQGHYNMARVKKKWEPTIVNLRKVVEDGKERWVEFEPSEYVIPAGHQYYDIIRDLNRQQLEKGA